MPGPNGQVVISLDQLNALPVAPQSTAAPASADKGAMSGITGSVVDALQGVLKGAGENSSKLLDLVPGFEQGTNDVGNAIGGKLAEILYGKEAVTPPIGKQQVRDAFAPENTAEKVGKTAENVGEFFLPAGGMRKGAVEGLVRYGIPNSLSPAAMNVANKAAAVAGRTLGEAGSAYGVSALHGDAHPEHAAEWGALGPLFGAGMEQAGPALASGSAAVLQNPVVQKILPFIAAGGIGKAVGGIDPTGGIGAGLATWGLIRSLVSDALSNPKLESQIGKGIGGVAKRVPYVSRVLAGTTSNSQSE